MPAAKLADGSTVEWPDPSVALASLSGLPPVLQVLEAGSEFGGTDVQMAVEGDAQCLAAGKAATRGDAFDRQCSVR